MCIFLFCELDFCSKNTMPVIKCYFSLLMKHIGLDKVGHVTKYKERFHISSLNLPKLISIEVNLWYLCCQARKKRRKRSPKRTLPWQKTNGSYRFFVQNHCSNFCSNAYDILCTNSWQKHYIKWYVLWGFYNWFCCHDFFTFWISISFRHFRPNQS